MKPLLTLTLLLATLATHSPAQSFTAPFSVLTSADGVDIYHVPVAVNITADEILIGKKDSALDVLFTHILGITTDTITHTTTYHTTQGTVTWATEGDCISVTWTAPTFAWRLYSTLPQWVRVENKR